MLCLQLSGDCDCNGDIGESTGANTDINSEAMIDSTVTGYGHGTMHGAIEVVEGLVQAAPRQQLAVDDDASDWHLLLPMLTPLCMCEGVGAWSPALVSVSTRGHVHVCSCLRRLQYKTADSLRALGL